MIVCAGTIQKREGFPVQSVHMFHAARYSDSVLTSLGGDFSKVCIERLS